MATLKKPSPQSQKTRMGKSTGTYVRRWYDDDPELAQIISKLEYARDDERVRVALLIIKTVIDRNVLELNYENIEDILASINAGYTDTHRSRWYDVNSTTRTAIQMLHDLPHELRHSIAMEIKQSHRYIGIFPI